MWLTKDIIGWQDNPLKKPKQTRKDRWNLLVRFREILFDNVLKTYLHTPFIKMFNITMYPETSSLFSVSSFLSSSCNLRLSRTNPRAVKIPPDRIIMSTHRCFIWCFSRYSYKYVRLMSHPLWNFDLIRLYSTPNWNCLTVCVHKTFY